MDKLYFLVFLVLIIVFGIFVFPLFIPAPPQSILSEQAPVSDSLLPHKSGGLDTMPSEPIVLFSREAAPPALLEREKQFTAESPKPWQANPVKQRLSGTDAEPPSVPMPITMPTPMPKPMEPKQPSAPPVPQLIPAVPAILPPPEPVIESMIEPIIEPVTLREALLPLPLAMPPTMPSVMPSAMIPVQLVPIQQVPMPPVYMVYAAPAMPVYFPLQMSRRLGVYRWEYPNGYVIHGLGRSK